MHHDIHISREQKTVEPQHALVSVGDTLQFHAVDADCKVVFQEEDEGPIDVDEEVIEAGAAGGVHEVGGPEGAFSYVVEFGDQAIEAVIVVDNEGEEEDFEGFEESGSADLAHAVSLITERVLDTIESAAAVRAGFFFPNGIDVIEVNVDIEGVKASVKIAGPKSS